MAKNKRLNASTRKVVTKSDQQMGATIAVRQTELGDQLLAESGGQPQSLSETSDLVVPDDQDKHVELAEMQMLGQKGESDGAPQSATDHFSNNIMATNMFPFPDLLESNCRADGRIKCGKCQFRTDSEAEMILHSINHISSLDISSSKLKCPTCGHYFMAKSLRKHIYIHTSENRFKCKSCGLDFTSENTLVKHEISQHKTDTSDDSSAPNLTCDTCGTSFGSVRQLRKHLVIHSADRTKNYVCDICNERFYEKEPLKVHVLRLHEPKASRRFKCQFEGCRYTCLYGHQLLEHQRVHSDDKPFVCDRCQYSAKSKWSFRKHYRTHTKEKPFKCGLCSYASALSSNLTRHMRVHTGSKPFKCPHCSYSCNNHENLKKHVLNTKRHPGLHLYNCRHCPFKTNVFVELRQHLEHTHKDIYTVEEIDRMISSVYHKNEDNTSFTTFVTLDNTSADFEVNEGSDHPFEDLVGSVVISIPDEEVAEDVSADKQTICERKKKIKKNKRQNLY